MKTSNQQTKPTSFLSVKYWPIQFGLAALKLIAKLPSHWRRKIGQLLGLTIQKLVKKRYKTVKTNLGLCYPGLSDSESESLMRKNFSATGQGLIETASCWYSDLSEQKKNSPLTGKQNLDSALSKGKGVILLSFHITSLEIGGCLLGDHYDIHGMYKPNKNPLIEHAMRTGRLRHIKGLLSRDNLRGTIKCLKKGEIVWYAADQNYGGKTSVFVPFFDIQTATITATTKLAKITGAAVVPFTQRRLEADDSYQLTLHPELENFPGENEVEDAARINRFLENYLKQYPVDYMWLHQRFRGRPAGEPPIY